MTTVNVSLEDLIDTREQLIATLLTSFTKHDKEFLLGIQQGIVGGEKLGFPEIYKLPGIRWKLMNIEKMTKQAKDLALKKLAKVLDV